MSASKKTVLSIYLATFFYALHFSLTLYVESSFLETFLSEKLVGLLFTVASLVSIIVIFNAPAMFRKIGNYTLTLLAVILEAFFLSVISLEPPKEIVILAFLAHQVLLALIFLSLNVFLEAFSKDETTGGTRGGFLTVLNSAILIGPLFAGGILGNDNYRNVFFWASIMVLPVLFFIGKSLRRFEDPRYDKISLPETFSRVISNKDLRSVFTIQFLLEFFFGIMVIYTPIYLHREIGIGLPEILGIIMPIALSPFVIFPYLLGNLADKKWGEKEMLLIGFLIAGLSTFYLSFIDSKEIAVWAIALFMTRVGASIIEIMAESYFFKHINATDTQVISLFRNLRPFSYIMSPVIASAFLSVFDFRYLFVALSVIVLFGVRYSLILKDTK